MSKIRLFVCSWHRKSCSEAERFSVPTGRKRYIKTRRSDQLLYRILSISIQRESSISSGARLRKVSEFDGLRFSQTRSFCSYRCLQVLRSALFRQKSQNGFRPIHRRRWHTDVLLCTRAAAAIFCFCWSASIPPHREHQHPPIVQSACPRSFCRLALRRWWCCTRKR